MKRARSSFSGNGTQFISGDLLSISSFVAHWVVVFLSTRVSKHFSMNSDYLIQFVLCLRKSELRPFLVGIELRAKRVNAAILNTSKTLGLLL